MSVLEEHKRLAAAEKLAAAVLSLHETRIAAGDGSVYISIPIGHGMLLHLKDMAKKVVGEKACVQS